MQYETWNQAKLNSMSIKNNDKCIYDITITLEFFHHNFVSLVFNVASLQNNVERQI